MYECVMGMSKHEGQGERKHFCNPDSAEHRLRMVSPIDFPYVDTMTDIP